MIQRIKTPQLPPERSWAAASWNSTRRKHATKSRQCSTIDGDTQCWGDCWMERAAVWTSHPLRTTPFAKERVMAKVTKGMIDPDDAVMLLIDHQSGLFQLVKDIDLVALRSNVIALAKAS